MIIALIVAAGSGERLGASGPKALVELAGRPMMQWSIDALCGVRGIEQIVVALPAGRRARPTGVDRGGRRSGALGLGAPRARGGGAGGPGRCRCSSTTPRARW